MLILNLIILSLLGPLAIIDMKTHTIPNTYLCYLSLPIFLYYIYSGEYLAGCLAFCIGGGLFLFLYLFTNSLGAGDVKFIMVIAWWISYPAIYIFLYLAIFCGAIWSIIYALHLKRRKVMIPFAPSLVIAAFITKFWGSALLNWWFHFILNF